MTVTFPDGVVTQGMASLWFLPAIANLTAPKVLVSEFSAASAINLTGMIEGFGVNADQSSGTDVRYGSTQVYQIPGRVTLSPSGTLNYVYDPQNPTSATYGAYLGLKLNTKGYLVNRLGVAVATAPAATQTVDVYPVQFGDQTRAPIDPTADAEKFKINQAWFIVGARVADVPVATS